ncbi:hypothetical protein [Streptomyces microflavus]|uniref:hypothetical protein n=1 Tax=Streptomyces microflavus TaxID=1919 RepID=UPI002E343B82|nr:hypothetical protein [Streptomyces microflavus]
MTTPVICRPSAFPIRRITSCPTCKQRRRMAGRDALWYGPTLTCCTCGDSWTCGEMHDRPFRRAWRTEAAAKARRTWTEAGAYTRADYDAWFAEAHGRPVTDVVLPEPTNTPAPAAG